MVKRYDKHYSKSIYFTYELYFIKLGRECVHSMSKKLTKCDFKLNALGPNDVGITWNAITLRSRGIRSMKFFANTRNPPFSKMSSALTKVNRGYARIKNLNPFSEYGLSVKEVGMETVKIGKIMTWPSGNSD